MNTNKVLMYFLINTLLLGGFPDFRVHTQNPVLLSEYDTIQNVPTKTYSLTQPAIPARIPSPYELIATPTPKPTATPKPTSTPTPTPEPTRVPLGKKKVQSKQPGNLTFQYPEAAPLNTDPANYTLMVNKEYPIASSYIPYMVEPNVEIYHKGINERRYLQPIAATALEELFAAAEDAGYHLVLRCGFRSYQLQKSIYIWNLKTYGYYEVSRYHALPGTSEHQTGLAVDLCCEATDYKNNKSFTRTGEYTWLLENAHLYGWILRYPEDKIHITGYNFEPWHFRYVGVELATYLKAQDIVLEEYYGALPTTNLAMVPKEYWSLLSKKDYALMIKEDEAFKKKQEEAVQQLTPSPAPLPENTDIPTQTPDNTDVPTELPVISESPTQIPDNTDIPVRNPDSFETPTGIPDEDTVPDTVTGFPAPEAPLFFPES